MEYKLYTDGACQPNPGPGGWAFVLFSDDRKITGQGSEKDTTNNRMELQALLQGLRSYQNIATTDDTLFVRSDSSYLVMGVRSWAAKWAKKGWKKKDGKPVLNTDLWKEIYELVNKLKVECSHVKSHSGHFYNEMVDKMATGMIK